MAMDLGDMWRRNLQQQLQGQGANQFAAAAQGAAQNQAMALGAATPGVSQAAAMRGAQQAAAQQAAGIQAQAARMRLAEQSQAMQMAQQQEAADRARMDRYIGMGVSAAGSAASMLLSDEDAKRELGGGDRAADQLIAGLEPEQYRYHGEDPGTVRLGVMAQDVERAGPMGEQMVGDAGGGMRGLDKDRALSAALATIGRLGERVEALEGRSGRKGGGRGRR